MPNKKDEFYTVVSAIVKYIEEADKQNQPSNNERDESIENHE